MKNRVLWTALLALSVPVAFASDNQPAAGPYIGTDVGYASFKEDNAYPGVNVTANSVTWGVRAGYRFNPFISLEASYLKAQPAHDTVNIPSEGIYGIDVSLSADGFEGAAIGSWPVTDVFGLYARLGILSWRSTIEGSYGGYTASEDETGTDALYGGGAYLNLGPQTTLRLEYTHATIKDVDMSRATVGIFWLL